MSSTNRVLTNIDANSPNNVNVTRRRKRKNSLLKPKGLDIPLSSEQGNSDVPTYAEVVGTPARKPLLKKKTAVAAADAADKGTFKTPAHPKSMEERRRETTNRRKTRLAQEFIADSNNEMEKAVASFHKQFSNFRSRMSIGPNALRESLGLPPSQFNSNEDFSEKSDSQKSDGKNSVICFSSPTPSSSSDFGKNDENACHNSVVSSSLTKDERKIRNTEKKLRKWKSKFDRSEELRVAAETKSATLQAMLAAGEQKLSDKAHHIKVMRRAAAAKETEIAKLKDLLREARNKNRETVLANRRASIGPEERASGAMHACNEDLKRKLEELRKRLSECGDAAADEVKKQCKEQFKSLTSKVKIAEEKMKSAEEKAVNLESELCKCKKQGEVLTEKLSKYENQSSAAAKESDLQIAALEKKVSEFESVCTAVKAEAARLAAENACLKSELETETSASKARLTVANREASEKIEELQSQVNDYEKAKKLASLNLEKEVEKSSQLVEEIEKLKIELEKATSEMFQAKEKLCFSERQLVSQQKKNEEEKARMLEIEKLNEEITNKCNALECEQKQSNTVIMELEEKCKSAVEEAELKCQKFQLELSAAEAETKKLFSELTEAKGNIRVIARVRPSSTVEDHEAANISFLPNCNGRKMILTEPCKKSSVGGAARCKSWPFSLNRVLPPHSTQEDMFKEVEDLVLSSAEGSKVCIFAYGQTGAGKTYSMMGPEKSVGKSDEGMIPRAISLAFQRMHDIERREGWKYDVSVRVVEIYNEKIRDLQRKRLVRSSSAGSTIADEEAAMEEAKSSVVKISHTSTGELVLTNCEVKTVTSSTEALALLEAAQANRAMGSTLMNSQSSRSHTVFTMRLSAKRNDGKEKRLGILQLIDLAGSERLDKSGSGKDAVQLREAQNINKSLSMLGDVIAALHRKAKHIPFRNSKLTSLLKGCLGGDSKTMMVVCLSPELQHLNESLCSLRFAKKVNACQVGRTKGGRCPLCNSLG
eukprot:g6464.t1